MCPVIAKAILRRAARADSHNADKTYSLGGAYFICLIRSGNSFGSARLLYFQVHAKEQRSSAAKQGLVSSAPLQILWAMRQMTFKTMGTGRDARHSYKHLTTVERDMERSLNHALIRRQTRVIPVLIVRRNYTDFSYIL